MKLLTKLFNYTKQLIILLFIGIVTIMFLFGTEITLKFSFKNIRENVKEGFIGKVKDGIHLVRDVKDIVR